MLKREKASFITFSLIYLSILIASSTEKKIQTQNHSDSRIRKIVSTKLIRTRFLSHTCLKVKTAASFITSNSLIYLSILTASSIEFNIYRLNHSYNVLIVRIRKTVSLRIRTRFVSHMRLKVKTGEQIFYYILQSYLYFLSYSLLYSAQFI